MNIIFLGDSSGNPDEGMKKIGFKLCEYCNKAEGVSARFLSVKEALKLGGEIKDVDILHYVSGPTWRSFLYAGLLKIKSGKAKTVISFVHPKWSFLSSLFNRLFSPDAYVVQSEKWRHFCSGLNKPVFDHPVAGIALDKFKPVDADTKLAIRKRLKLPLDKKIVLHVGHLNHGRNIQVFTKISKLPDLYPLIVASTTTECDKELYSKLTSAGVKIIREYIADIEEYYQAADCYLFPTIDANKCVQIPLSVIEALACGIPAVTTPFEGLPNYLPEFPGLTYISDFDDLPGMIAAVSGNENTNRSGLRIFDWDDIVRKLLDFYEKELI